MADDNRGLRVWVVDDDPLVLAVTKRALGRLGYEVSTFDGGQRALAELAHAPPFAVVADLNMPDMDGPELLSRVRQAAPDALRLLYTGEGQSELADTLEPGLAHAVVPKTDGNRLLPEALARLRAERG